MDIFYDSLYGTSRLISSRVIKDLLVKDNVLQKGEWDSQVNGSRTDPWTTTTSSNFEKPLPALNDTRRKIKSVDRDVSSIRLGSSSNHILPTTLKDFERKWLDAPKKAKPDLGTTIPDFATKYLVNKKVGDDGSIYSSSFNQVKKLDTFEYAKERQHHTKDLRTTHFNLGSNPSHYDTETSQKFLSSSLSTDNPASISASAALKTHRSNVFRNGDWNISGHPSMPSSVTRNDFHIKPFTSAITDTMAGPHSLPRQTRRKKEQIMMPLEEKMKKAITADSTNQKDKLLQAFAQSDTGRFGFITKEQLRSMISMYVPSATEEEINHLITQSNSVKTNGKIDYSALADYIFSLSTDKPEETEKPFLNIHEESYTGTHHIKTCYPSTDTRKPKDDPSHPYYHNSTHFQLGDCHNEQNSVSHHDYVVRDPWQLKPLFALPPLSSQVLPETHEFGIRKSTKQSDFVYNALEGKSAAQTREREMKNNQNRLAKQSIELSADPAAAQAYRQASVFGKDFPSPPADFKPLTPKHAPLSKYRYLDANAALVVLPATDPYLSEKQEKFQHQGSLMTHKDKTVECLERTNDNRASHFTLGADSDQKRSEQHHQFSKKTPIDASVPAAGKKQTAEQDYSHVFPRLKTDDEGKIEYFELMKSFTEPLAMTRGSKPEMTSIMKTDYRPPEERSFSSAQRRSINITAKPFTIMDSHYFHYDHSTERATLSTTGHDFSRPDRLGTQRTKGVVSVLTSG